MRVGKTRPGALAVNCAMLLLVLQLLALCPGGLAKTGEHF
jgi:hypothetical protein